MSTIGSDIEKALRNASVESGDFLYVHGDASIAAQYKELDPSECLRQIFQAILDYLGDQGTLVVPAFTYSATKGELFDPERTQSGVGRFSEEFRKFPGVIRSSHPIFSVVAKGLESNHIDRFTNTDCFGKESFFNYLHHRKSKIITLGFLMKKGVTFTHYVEQMQGVNYRYFKNFESLVYCNGRIRRGEVRYFVRDVEFDSQCDLTYFVERAREKGVYQEVLLGRLPLCVMRADQFFKLAAEIIDDKPYGLTKAGVHSIQLERQ